MTEPTALARPLTEVAREAGLTMRQADYWARAGIIQCLPRPAGAGSGYYRAVTPAEARVVILTARLTRVGLNPRAAATAARQIVDGDLGHLGDGLAVLDTTHPKE